MSNDLQSLADLDLNEECRALWRGVAISYASDGGHMDHMAQWADQAVADYRKRFAKEFDLSSRDADRLSNDSVFENLHDILFAALTTTNFTLVTIPANGVDGSSTLSLEVHVPPGVTIDVFINKLVTALYGHGLLNLVPGQISYMSKEVNRERRYLITDKYSMKPARLMQGLTVLHDSSFQIAAKADVLNVYRLDIKL